MTPMVDLGFLLISFFVIATELTKPRAMDIVIPKDGPPMKTKLSTTITILLSDNNAIYYYHGEEKDAANENRINKTNWDEEMGVGKLIREMQARLDQDKIGRDELFVIIKPGSRSTYTNMVDILDEMTIHRVLRYAIVEPGLEDKKWLETH